MRPVGGADPFGVLIVTLLGLRNFFVGGDREVEHSGGLNAGFRAWGISWGEGLCLREIKLDFHGLVVLGGMRGRRGRVCQSSRFLLTLV